LTRQRYELLLAIRTAPGQNARAPLRELMERLQLAQSSVVELVDRAEALGLVTRTRDRRQVVVGLTPEGERRLAGAASELALHRRRLVSILSHL
jgi:DNA-binding MarR family transcriptional regulator